MRKVLFWKWIAAAVLAVPSVASAETVFKVGIVDLQRVLMESTAGRIAKELLDASTKDKKAQIDKMSEDFKKLREDYDKKSGVMSDDARQQAERDIVEKQIQLKQLFEQFNADLQRQDSDLTRSILAELDPMIKDIAAKEGFSLVLERSEGGVLFAPDKTDLTDRLIDMYNKKKESPGKKK